MTFNSNGNGNGNGNGEGPCFRDLMEALGRVIFRWGQLEELLREGPKPTGALAGQLRHLRAQRNMLAHGIVSGRTDPEVGTGAILCRRNRKPTGAMPDKVFTLAELNHLAEAMNACRLRLHRSRP